jgi:glutamate-5-semialdehyde dehydrogenase
MSGETTVLPKEIDSALDRVRAASRRLRTASLKERNLVLEALERKMGREEAAILDSNKIDLAALGPETTEAFRDRLLLTPERISGMRESLRQVVALDDPLGEVVEERDLKNGLHVKRVRSPLGVILMIFESRPNVAIEAFSLALKSGNALILRAGKESKETTTILYRLISEAMVEAKLPSDAFFGLTDPDRALFKVLLTEGKRIDVVVPRGGDALIKFVAENAQMPVIKNDRGLCHIYVHSDADLSQAAAIVENAKVQRPGVCNSLETLLVHAQVANSFVRELSKRAGMKTVEFHAEPRALAAFQGAFGAAVVPADPADFDTEYLDLKLNVKLVDTLEEAISHIEIHGSKHSESILTRDEKVARTFQSEIDAAVVYWNASTRFTDGFELGLGGELGISTQKLHVRGPVGLRELTSVRWVIDGKGQIR